MVNLAHHAEHVNLARRSRSRLARPAGESLGRTPAAARAARNGDLPLTLSQMVDSLVVESVLCRLKTLNAGVAGEPLVGAHPERSPEEDFQPRARQLTPSADWRHSGEHRGKPSQATPNHTNSHRRRVRRYRHQPAV